MAAENVETGWITVHGQSQGHPDRFPAAQREPFERSLIKKWEASDGHWSGIGKHPDFVESKKLHHKIVAPKDNILGCGAYGHVEKVSYQSVCLARKWIKPRRNRTLDILRAESHVMEKLDHDHIVKLIGTYTFRQRELYLLLWPVAVCNLSELLADIEYFRNGEGDGGEDIRRLEALGLTDLGAIKAGNRDAATKNVSNKCPLNFLQRIMGCIGQAVAYCHRAKIRHLDIKPANILLNPERVYLADFGIARDVADQERTTTIGHQGTPKWRAPEICDPEDWSMRAAEIYSLGLIYLNIATAVYHGSLSAFDAILEDPTPASRVAKLRDYQHQLALEALATQQFHDSKAPTVTPRHVLDLTRRMLSLDPASRPDVFQVDLELVDLGGIDQVYHGQCCRKPTRYVASRIDNRLSAVKNENLKLKADNERLKRENAGLNGMDETYTMRIANQEKTHAKRIEILMRQLEEERERRKGFEDKLKATEMQTRRLNRTGIPRADNPQDSRIAFANLEKEGLGIRPRPRTQPVPKSAVQPPPPTSEPSSGPLRPMMAARGPTDPVRPAWQARNPAVMSSIPAPPAPRTTEPPSPNPQTPSATLPSRGSASRLPVLAKTPATPRMGTPKFARDSSLTDSTQASMSSSLFSRRSFETATEAAPTPPAASPIVNQGPPSPTVRNAAAQPAPSDEPRSPASSITPSVASALSSPPMTKAEMTSHVTDLYEGLSRVKIPSLQPAKSWAAVAGEAKGLAKMIIGSPPKASAMPPQVAAAAVGRGRSRDRNPAGS